MSGERFIYLKPEDAILAFERNTGFCDYHELRRLAHDEWENDWYTFTQYGIFEDFWVTPHESPMEGIVLYAPNGLTFSLGCESVVLAKDRDGGCFEPRLLKDMEPGVYEFFIPQKKTKECLGDLLDIMADDKDAVKLIPKHKKDIIPIMQRALRNGILTHSNPEGHITVEPARPVCYATKRIIGSFVTDYASTARGLINDGVITPTIEPSTERLQEMATSGVITEGYCIYNIMPYAVSQHRTKASKVFRVQAAGDTRIETPWGMF